MTAPDGEAHFLFTWRKAMRESDLPSLSKLVMHTMSNYMDLDGNGAHPGHRRLEQECSISRDSLSRHLGFSLDAGWLVVTQPGVVSVRGGTRRATTYAAAIPEDVGTPETGTTSRPVRPADRSDGETRPVRLSTPTGPTIGLHLLENSPENSLMIDPPKKQKHKAQISEGFEVTPSLRQWCIDNGIRSNPDSECPKFIDHHRSKGTLFADPVAAFRTWMRNADKFSKLPGGQPSKSMANVDRVLASITASQKELT